MQGGEPQIVADRQPEHRPVHGGDDRLVARLVDRRFAMPLARRKIDVEHVKLVIGRGDAAVGIDQDRAIGGLAVRPQHHGRADQQPYAQFAGQRAIPDQRVVGLHRRQGGEQVRALALQQVASLRGYDQRRAACGRSANQRRGLVQGRGLRGGRAQLDERGGERHPRSNASSSPFCSREMSSSQPPM